MVNRHGKFGYFYSIFPLIFILISTACSTRPLPEGVVRYNTFYIAQKIRCDLRDSIRKRIFSVLESYKEADALARFRQKIASAKSAGRGDLIQEAENVADVYADFFAGDYFGVRSEQARSLLATYAGGIIAYEFQFDISETNTTGGGIDVLNVLTRGTLNVPLTGSIVGKRQNIRNFKALDSFGELASNRPTSRVCAEFENPRESNLLYPISGSLGLIEVLDTFISLNQSANLVGNTDNAPNIPTLADTMTFTTILTAGTNPVLQLNPVGTGWQIKGGSLNANFVREDVHKLVLALTLPDIEQPFAVTRAQRERAALDELERQRILEIDEDTRDFRRKLRAL